MASHVTMGAGLPQPVLEYLKRYTDLGLYCEPLCSPDTDGNCACGWGHDEKEAGKAPRTINGIKDASNDISSLITMWRSFPVGNIAIGLEKSELLLIGPDAPEWLAEFKKRGLPETAPSHIF